MSSIWMRLSAVVLAIFVATSVAEARQDEPLPQSVARAFTDFQNAMERRDYEAARSAAHAAWQAGEQEEIDPALIGILARNYGELSEALGVFEDAYSGWRTSAEIASQAGTDSALIALSWQKAAMMAFLNGEFGDARRCANNADRAYQSIPTEQLDPQQYATHAYVFARSTMATGRGREAGRRARAALERMAEFHFEHDKLYSDLVFLSGMGAIHERSWEDAYVALHRSGEMYANLELEEDQQIAQALNSYVLGELDFEEQRAAYRRVQASDYPKEGLWNATLADGVRRIGYSPTPHTNAAWISEGLNGSIRIAYQVEAGGRVTGARVIGSDFNESVNRQVLTSFDRWWFDDVDDVVGQTFEIEYEIDEGRLQDPMRSADQEHNYALPLYRIEPVYPARAASRGYQGVSVLKYDLNDDGTTTNIRVLLDVPAGEFDEVSVAAIQQWRHETVDQARQSGGQREGLITQFVFTLSD